MCQKKRSATTILAILFCVLPGCVIYDTTKSEIQSIRQIPSTTIWTNYRICNNTIGVVSFIFIGVSSLLILNRKNLSYFAKKKGTFVE